MEIGYKVVRKLDGQLVSSTINKTNTSQKENLVFSKTYGIGLITEEVSILAPLFIFESYEDAKYFCGGSDSLEIYKAAYEPSLTRPYIVRDVIFISDLYKFGTGNCPLRTAPCGTRFAKKICLISKV